MQYVRSITGSVSKGWNSINPATLSGAIDVIVVEQEDGSLACSPFHIRFGKFSLLRPYEKKVEFKVNGEKQDYPMKLGEGGEAFFVFETLQSVPTEFQTSPVVSPAASPELKPSRPSTPTLQEPDPFSLNDRSETPTEDTLRQPPRGHSRSTTEGMPIPSFSRRAQSDMGQLTPLSSSPNEPVKRQPSGSFSGIENPHLPKLDRSESDTAIIAAKAAMKSAMDHSQLLPSAMSDLDGSPLRTDLARSNSDLSVDQQEAKQRAMNLSKKLWTSNISNQVTESGDLMLDMAGFKGGNMEALQAEGIARQLLSEEVDGPYDIGALIGADEMGNIWIYGSEEAKEAANKRAAAATALGGFNPAAYASTDAISDPGYHSDDARSDGKSADYTGTHIRRDSDSAVGMPSQPSSPVAGDPNKNYAKTLRLTSDQLKSMNLESGANNMAFTVNRSTCTATLWYWKHDVPIVISDIDGTITKSDVLGHVMTTIGRDWTHQGVAKLYTEIASNGYNFLYLTSRSVGQADMTRGYLKGVVQEGYKLPPGPVILSPDRMIAALRREVYLRKPEIFKMACLRDIMALFAGHGGSNNTHESVEAGLKPNPDLQNLGTGKGKSGSPFYAGFGNRLTDALSYRSVNIPSTRIFTINSNSEVSLDLLSLNNYKTAYSTMREIVDHYFPPVGLLVKGGGEEFTDFNYWRDKPLDIIDFTDSEDEGDEPLVNALARVGTAGTHGSVLSEDEAGDMADSYLSDPRASLDQSIAETLDDDEMTQPMLDNEELEGDDEEEFDEEEDESEPDFELELEDSRGGAQSPAQKASQPSTPDMSSTPDAGRTPRQARANREDQPNRVADRGTGLGLSTLDQKSPRKR
ncbi:Nuclear elongation and deformation protein 1 [Fulvia fulva]|uniref:Nuclear elongation and deformation protein 1 n=1 Tax=Passalora fulva TaxID=5499 RepID=A0A9Q8PHK8_PASFU|nr:Nuclear elongation and deformation protein 1 [Fulvia fulva]KAK4626455.1 Nuclear elongation and deformation protein 1 [Fulvia fulva]KAK4628259.1 Nuclear elongation and deformation protein 1 [Fulvia fulva]UJO22550.1 Nuclear elongation and deformation protein 1 [Fulvia fulva]WPV14212.1 Nuclear elongation and deformation protein 1 [Fulvia fulva]WPV28174.1 Nuclear elongation and deformation protein 1 [Fulvia fulva]